MNYFAAASLSSLTLTLAFMVAACFAILSYKNPRPHLVGAGAGIALAALLLALA